MLLPSIRYYLYRPRVTFCRWIQKLIVKPLRHCSISKGQGKGFVTLKRYTTLSSSVKLMALPNGPWTTLGFPVILTSPLLNNACWPRHPNVTFVSDLLMAGILIRSPVIKGCDTKLEVYINESTYNHLCWYTFGNYSGILKGKTGPLHWHDMMMQNEW